MGFTTTDLHKSMGIQIPNVVYSGRILTENPYKIKELFFKQPWHTRFVFLLLNNNNDIYVAPSKCINFFKRGELDDFGHVMEFMHAFCDKKQCSQIEEHFLQFPNSTYRMRYMTLHQFADPMNNLMITVKSKKIQEGCPVVLKIIFSSKTTTGKQQLHNIILDWIFDTLKLGCNNEFIELLNENYFSKNNNANYFKFLLKYTGNIHFPFLELYLRINTFASLDVRPVSICFYEGR